MHRRIVAALVCGLFLHVCAAADAPQANRTAEPPPQRIRTTLANGLHVVVIADHLAPVATSVVAYGVGGRDTPAHHPGLAHAVEHMMFQGSPGLSRDQNLGLIAALGGAANAQTLTDYTEYFATVPAQYLDVLLRMQAIHMSGANDAPDRWAHEKEAIKQEVSGDLSNPAFRAQSWMRGKLLAGTPLAATPLGTATDFDATTAKRIAAFHQAWYTPNNASITVVGDFAPKTVLATIKKRFGDIPRHDVPDHPSGQLDALKAAHHEFVTDSGLGSVSLGYRTPGQADPQTMAAMWLLSDVLNDQTGPLFSHLVATGESPSTSAALTSYASAGTAIISASFRRGQDTDKLTQDLAAVLHDFADQGVTAKQLAAAKRQATTAHESALDSIPGLARTWASTQMTGQGSPDRMQARIQSISLKQINALAQQIFDTDKRVTALLTPMGKGQVASVAQAGGNKKDKLGGKHPPAVKLPHWASKRLSALHVPKPSVDPVETELGNGLKLIVVPSPDVHGVHVLGSVTSNPYLQTPKGKFGVSGLVARLMSFGTTQHDRMAFQQAANDIGADLSVGSRFSMTIMPDELGPGLALLAEGERHPAFPKPLFRIFRQNYAAAMPGVLSSASWHSRQSMAEGLLPADDPKLRHETAKSIKSISYDDLKAYYKQTFRPDVTTLVVVGNVKPAHVKKLVARDFGDWKAKGKRPRLFLSAVPMNKASRHRIPDDSRSQDAVTDAELIDVRRTDKNYDALVLGNEVLSGGMLNSRLYRALRLQRGLVYKVDSSLSTSPHRTSFIIDYASDPDDVQTAGDIIKSELNKLRDKPLPHHTLQQAKAGVLRRLALSEYSADAIGRAVASRAIQGLALDYPYQRAAEVPHISAKQVQTAFRQWIRPDDFVSIILGPKTDN